jgi:hypothetical protein
MFLKKEIVKQEKPHFRGWLKSFFKKDFRIKKSKPCGKKGWFSFLPSSFFLLTRPRYVAQAGLELTILLSPLGI